MLLRGCWVVDLQPRQSLQSLQSLLRSSGSSTDSTCTGKATSVARRPTHLIVQGRDLGPCKTCWNNNASGVGPRRARDFAGPGDRLGAASARGVAGDPPGRRCCRGHPDGSACEAGQLTLWLPGSLAQADPTRAVERPACWRSGEHSAYRSGRTRCGSAGRRRRSAASSRTGVCSAAYP